jgi:hypothetical protein
MEPALSRRRAAPPGLHLLLLLLALSAGPAWAQAPEVATVVTQAGARFAFQVELAETPAARARGLMYRRQLADDAGMLFLFEREETQAFWMKNTEISLDMLFLSADGRIVDLHREAVPLSTRSIASAAPARAVLEVPGGTAARLGIRIGDRVEHPALARR